MPPPSPERGERRANATERVSRSRRTYGSRRRRRISWMSQLIDSKTRVSTCSFSIPVSPKLGNRLGCLNRSGRDEFIIGTDGESTLLE
ncbi:hypothetical protein Bca52824_009444 [Brassica carinata]|uniref:Uncharacterized protein n=1 Tax=Brassica carinata TaxID=52824 RepID=A0A8X7WAX8_BRACI|nr:hypothetical protein Bca52824_009444 [Brassica carinata]